MKKPDATITSAYWVTLKATIWSVKVLPILAPMITPTDWTSVLLRLPGGLSLTISSIAAGLVN